MQFLIASLLTLSTPCHIDVALKSPAPSSSALDAERSQAEGADQAPVAPSALVLSQSSAPRQRPGAQRPSGPATAKKTDQRPVRPREEKKRGLALFWRLFPPPGPYTREVGLSLGSTFLETAFGGRNPNIIGRGHFAFRPIPERFPLVVYGAADYSNYKQTAGPLEYTSRFISTVAGAGVNYWYGPLRLDLMGEAGILTRIASQTDGQIDPITNFNVQPVIGAVAGGAFGLGGRVALSLRTTVRAYDFGPSRVDVSVLYGVEWMIDAKPRRVY